MPIHIQLTIYSLGIKLGDASKKFGKKFASGASVVKVKNPFILNWLESSELLEASLTSIVHFV